MLETKYSLSCILTKIQETYTENTIITTICDDIFDMSSTNWYISFINIFISYHLWL